MVWWSESPGRRAGDTNSPPLSKLGFWMLEEGLMILSEITQVRGLTSRVCFDLDFSVRLDKLIGVFLAVATESRKITFRKTSG